MELEIESQHKSPQSVGRLVWPSTVPRLRSLSTEQSQAKHIFIDCECVCVLERAVCARQASLSVSFSVYTQNKSTQQSVWS